MEELQLQNFTIETSEFSDLTAANGDSSKIVEDLTLNNIKKILTLKIVRNLDPELVLGMDVIHHFGFRIDGASLC